MSIYNKLRRKINKYDIIIVLQIGIAQTHSSNSGATERFFIHIFIYFTTRFLGELKTRESNPFFDEMSFCGPAVK